MPIKSFVNAAVLATGLLGATFAAQVQSHPLWILPGEFTVSGEDSEWISFDVSASHTVFGYDKGVGLNNLSIFTPDGDRQRVGSYFKGHRRSVFDLELDQDGTYKLSAQRPQFYFTSYKAGKRDTPKRMMADKVAAQAKLPKDARDVKTMLIDMQSVAFVTRNAPTNSVYAPKNKGLELNPLTHPNDIVQGEVTEIDVLLDGKPAEGVTVEITPGGTRYRNERGSIELTTDKTGRISFTPEQAGPWLLMAEKSIPSDSPLADSVEAIRYLTFEVIAE